MIHAGKLDYTVLGGVIYCGLGMIPWWPGRDPEKCQFLDMLLTI